MGYNTETLLVVLVNFVVSLAAECDGQLVTTKEGEEGAADISDDAPEPEPEPLAADPEELDVQNLLCMSINFFLCPIYF